MIFLIGAAALVAAVMGASTGRERGGRRARAALVVAALPLAALLLSGHDLARYRFTLLGLRYRLGAADTLTVGGDPDVADLLVPGAGERPVAVLTAEGDTSPGRVLARPQPDAAAVVLVEEERLLGRDAYHVLGAVPLAIGDTIDVAGHHLRVGSAPTLLGRLRLPWARRHVIELVTDRPRSDAEADPGRVALPPVTGWRRLVAPRKPGVLQRTFPVADLLDRLMPGEDAPRSGLSSFLFYDDAGRLSIALLDSEVRVGTRSPPPLPLWTEDDGGRRVLVAGLPLRDFPEPDLTLPERYGVRPLRSYRFAVEEGWLEARPSQPEIHALDRDALEALDVADRGAVGAYRIRLSPGRGTMLRQAVVLSTPSLPFAAAGQAVFILPRNPARGDMEVVTPSGLARWRSHHPISLGDRDRSVLLRVDGQGLSVRTILAYAILLGLAVSVFWIWPMSGPHFALAVVLLGLGAVRLLLGLSAHAVVPFDQEAQQLALWVLPFGPWLVAIGAEIGAAIRGVLDGGAPSTSPAAGHAAFGLALAALAWVLFPDSMAKRLSLAALPLALVTARLLVPAFSPVIRRVGHRLGRAGHPATLRGALLGPGFRLGALLLAVRAVLAVVGIREQVVLFGTRVGVSVLYTPASLTLFAWILWRGLRRVAAAGGEEAVDREGAWLLVNAGAFVVLAFAAVSALVSDYGVLFTTLPGALVVLLVLGGRWGTRSSRPTLATALAAVPLVLFLAVQLAPAILHPGDREADPRQGGMAEWSRNELLLLEREDPQALRLIGQRRSEALAVMRETMRSYTRGNWTGHGLLRGRVSEEVRPTATREHAVSALIAGQWGALGTGGLLLLLGGLMVPLRRSGPGAAGPRPFLRRDRSPARVPVHGPGPPRGSVRAVTLAAAGFLLAVTLLPRPFGFAVALLLSLGVLAVLLPALRGASDGSGPAPGGTRPSGGGDPAAALGSTQAPGAGRSSNPGLAGVLAAVLLATLTFAGIYMVLANYGWVLFTGKNVYLLGLDSVSDLLEAALLIGPAAAALAFRDEPPPPLPAVRPTGRRQ